MFKFKEICTAVVNEDLICLREPFNTADTAVGHVPRKILSVCSFFLV